MLPRIDPVMSGLELIGDVINKPAIPINSPEVNIPRRRHGPIIITFDPYQRSVESSASKVVDEDCLRRFGLALWRQKSALNTVGDGGRSRFIDDIDDLETCELTGFLRCLASGLVEKRGNSNDDLSNWPQFFFLRRLSAS